MPQLSFSTEDRIQRSTELGLVVDPEFYHLLEQFTWSSATAAGHVNTSRGFDTETNRSKKFFLHHFVIGLPPEGMVVDHIDRNPRNNRLNNLRFISQAQNVGNCTRRDDASYIYNSRSGRYYVLIKRNKQAHHLGTYDTVEECVAVRDAWLKEHDLTL